MEARKFEELAKDESFMKAIEALNAGKLSYKEWNPAPGFGGDFSNHNIKYLEYLEIHKHSYLALVAELGAIS